MSWSTSEVVRFAAVAACVAWAGAALATPAYDGTYKGEVTRTRGDDSVCGKPSYHVTYNVINGQFTMLYDAPHHIGVNVTVADDGSFSGSQEYMPIGTSHRVVQLHAHGRIAGGVFEADIDGDACSRHYHLTKS